MDDDDQSQMSLTFINKQQSNRGSLINQDNEKIPEQSFFLDFVRGPQCQKCIRKVYLNGNVVPRNRQKNKIVNSKYNFLTFIPLVLYKQFHQFTNLFYLSLAITQFIPPLKVGYFIGYVGPLTLVMSLSMLKELYDDIQRHKRDNQLNHQTYLQLNPNGEMTPIRSQKLRVGMIIEVNQNQRIPADILVLQADDEQGFVFIRTDQLDGETDWKLRKAVKYTQNKHKEDIFDEFAYAKCMAPTENIYQFNAVFISQNHKESLSLENVIWANTVLATGKLLGLVIYSGKETRMSMNSRSSSVKFGKLDKEINYMSFLLFLFMISMAGILTFLCQPPLDAALISTTYIRFLILMANIIPISMRVNIEFAKLTYSIRINLDQEIPGTITRNSNIPESLGRIQYLLTDKTGSISSNQQFLGTLTKNDMIFQKLSMEQCTYTSENLEEMKQIFNQDKIQASSVSEERKDQSPSRTVSKSLKRDKDLIFKDFVYALAICHNVTPTYENEIREYQASSPDEIALVKIAESIGLFLQSRNQNQLILTHKKYNQMEYEILNNFPFTSETKRMGIIVKTQEGKYIFYLKGADIVMKHFVKEYVRGFIDEECENLAREGLRTLVITQKELTKAEYEEWALKYDQANQTIDNREAETQKVINQLEHNMEFLGISGVEDKLQDEVCQTIENIRNGGINVWMLTGDKVETAICIAISSGIKSPQQSIFLIKEETDEVKIQVLLNQFDVSYSQNSLMVIDGTSLATALTYHEKLFFTVACQSISVVCCRCSPTQKAIITDKIKQFTGKVTASIGDGGNDVGMIQCADIGIGIEGKEGKQAALASDFSLKQFKNLNKLLFWHGRLSYKRSALLSQFVIHRGLIITSLEAIFIVIFYFLSISIFSGILMLGYGTVFTQNFIYFLTFLRMFPVFCIIFDQDVDNKTALMFPPLYRSLQKGRDLNGKTFLTWVWKAIYQGTIIMMLSLILIRDIFLKIETVCFTSLIFTEYLMTLTQVIMHLLQISQLHSIHIVTILSNIGSAMVYILTIYYFPEQLNLENIDKTFFLHLLIIVSASWAPVFLFTIIHSRIDPTDYQKLMKSTRKESINTQFT